MIDPNRNNAKEKESRHVFGWFLFPIFSLFPLMALMTYDWRAVAALRSPAEPSTNWIGTLGDGFAYYGYTLIGLATWMIPVVCIVAGICLAAGRRMRPDRRALGFLVSLVAMASLVQVLQHHAPGVTALTDRLNIANAGGAVGYLIMDRLLSPLVSDFGATVIVVVTLAISLVGAIGVHNLANALMAVCQWATARNLARTVECADDDEAPAAGDWGRRRESSAPDEPKREAAGGFIESLKAVAAAREAAKREREAEKAKIRAEKERLKQEKLAAKAAEKAAREAASRPQPTQMTVDFGLPPAPAAASAKPAAVTRNAAAALAREDASAPESAPVDKGPYLLPPLSLLNPIPHSTADHGDVNEMSKRLIDTLMLFGVEARLDYTVQGPVVTKYAIELKPGTRYSAVTNISDNLMGALRAKSLRIEAPIPGEDRVGIEVPNRAAAGISFREIIESKAWKDNVQPIGDKPAKYQLPLLFGKDAAGKDLVADLATMPHMLVAGATGQGKSVCLNSIINGLLMTRTPQELKFIMVDPKSVEFTAYAAIPHLIVPVITDNKKVVFSLQWAVVEMEKRLKLFARARCRNIMDYNHRKTFTQTDMFGSDTEVGSDMPRTVPYIVIIIDEVADLMSTSAKEVVPNISRLTAKARAAGIHLILATQRPDAKVITGTMRWGIAA